MGLGRTHAVALSGVEGQLVEVEAHMAQGLPAMTMSGLPDAACSRAPNRVRAAAEDCGVPIPQRRWTINLTPAWLPKAGSGFDVGIAVAQLAANDVLPARVVESVVHIGELGLDGAVRPVAGVLPMVAAAAAAGMRTVVVPTANVAEAALVPNISVYGVASLRELIDFHLAARVGIIPTAARHVRAQSSAGPLPDMADVVGQPEARAALEVAAAGRHHMLMVGAPGAGKTMLAERLPGLLPALEQSEALEVTAVHSVLGVLDTADSLVSHAPFVAPHHGASMAAVIGGGSARVRPGAVSRAHRGVLFLDETPEFRRDVLDGLRQPLESGEVVIARAERQTRLPARFQLVAAANPCPCGRGIGKGAHCHCTPLARRTYFGKLSGPLLDRIDVRVSLFPVNRLALSGPPGEPTLEVAQRVLSARERQRERWSGTPWTVNAEVPGSVLRGEWRLPRAVTAPLEAAMDRGELTLRGHDRCLRVAWTVADLAGAERPGREHLGQALALRSSSEVAA
ncbi:YifB family Mg chelatase-like AAA ATPase [Ornithinimicrobium cryptoxanthini]|uniref:YifB family Mg chelatase-like AAA ATPase n=1 Tax=Ornithinimicrobium cryptoxanthini TaxID=2934161 RepID=A0ABY4YMM0_9MICO|nr:YifB family Mg chelatase-like AAA ATPase [Ornithinimicrobium cryptoxanthini]USQ78056.1 YifB family Mg chelatase-like AAA ATPase [Ornithinimicrobium cryptoxanthini]